MLQRGKELWSKKTVKNQAERGLAEFKDIQ